MDKNDLESVEAKMKVHTWKESSWCPVCGDCACRIVTPTNIGGFSTVYTDKCPLHHPDSVHQRSVVRRGVF